MKKKLSNIIDNYKKLGFSYINSLIDKIKDLRVMIVGDSILDEYIYTDTLGKSAKESILATLKKMKKFLQEAQLQQPIIFLTFVKVFV